MKKIDLFASESVKTSLIEACENFKELEAIIIECEPWVSYSRPEPVYWTAEKLLERLDMVKKGGNHNLVTRANGIREKMIELLSKK